MKTRAINSAPENQVQRHPDLSVLAIGFGFGKFAAKLHLRKLPTIKVISVVGCLAGLTAILAGCSSPSTSNSATPVSTESGKSVTADEIKNYARAVLAIEPIRQAAYTEIQKLTNDEKVDVTCTKADTIAALPKSIQDVAVNYCNQSKKIGESNGLTMAQFNAVTVSAQSNSELRQRIQNELLRLQK
jgi:hypothetical protein